MFFILVNTKIKCDLFHVKSVVERNFQLFARKIVCEPQRREGEREKIPLKNMILIEYLWYLFSISFLKHRGQII